MVKKHFLIPQLLRMQRFLKFLIWGSVDEVREAGGPGKRGSKGKVVGKVPSSGSIPQ